MARSRVSALALGFLLVALAGNATATSVDRPSWTAGDFWTYRTNTTLTPGLNLTGTATSTVTGTTATATGGTPVDAYRVVLTGSGTAAGHLTTGNGTIAVTGSWTLTGEERFEPRDLHPIYSLLDLSVNGTYQYVVPYSLRLQNTTTYAILSDGWGYPWVAGSSGNVTAAYNFTQDLYSSSGGHVHQNGTGRWTLGFSLGDAVQLSAPAGTFESFPVREAAPDGTWQRLFYSAAVGNNVRTESYDRGGNLTAVSTLVAYRYHAAEPSNWLGLSTDQWLLVLGAVAVAATATAFLVVRRRRIRRNRSRGDESPREPTSGPRGP
ncbi:MAG TPA: hypothetical protein VEY12_07055 [Thermoplasmata archaeon]|nr:hypothetical protein [Thermoplasmata archaeon]